MRVKKTITEAVLHANRENGKKSPGPKDTSQTKNSAKKHGFLSGRIQFADENQQKEFADVLAELEEDCRPTGPREQMQVEVMAISQFLLRDLYSCEFGELSNWKNGSATLLRAMTDDNVARQAVLRAAIEQECHVEALMWRAGPRCRNDEQDPLDEITGENKNIVVGAKLASRLDLIDRYRTKHLRIYHAALAALRELQRERAEREELRSRDGDSEADHGK